MGKIDLNIQPKASVYGLFARLNYTEWFALAEFVDNSTASYYSHRRELTDSHFDKLKIDINYDSTTDSITIEDNAYGMELEDFKRAILLDSKPSSVGRNEFGYGLKTAATWFGKRWSVESTQLDSTNRYYACIDIDEIVSKNKSTAEIKVDSCNYIEHYTKIVIQKLNRRLNTTKIKNKIINVLDSMYRRDLKAGNIEIIYNGITLNFSDYPILNFRGQVWKKAITEDEMTFDFCGKRYSAKGFVGIMEPGGFDKSGFALFRHDRAIVCNYKPKEIFGSQAQTQVALKLFGELDMDLFDVNQAKDGFSWNSELEELFISKLKNCIQDFIEIAKMSKKERENETSASTISNNSDCVPNVSSLEEKNCLVTTEDAKEESEDHLSSALMSVPAKEKALIESTPQSPSFKGSFKIKYDANIYEVIWDESFEGRFLFNFSNESNILRLNAKHEFLKGKNDENVCIEIAKFVLAYVLTEERAKKATATNGYVSASFMHNQLDKILAALK